MLLSKAAGSCTPCAPLMTEEGVEGRELAVRGREEEVEGRKPWPMLMLALTCG